MKKNDFLPTALAFTITLLANGSAFSQTTQEAETDRLATADSTQPNLDDVVVHTEGSSDEGRIRDSSADSDAEGYKNEAGAEAIEDTSDAVAENVPESDPVLEFQLLQAGAAQGIAADQFALGMKYKQGEVVDKNEDRAFYWFSLAAEQGHSGAQYQLAKCYHHGSGVDRDRQVALEWYQKAAEQQNADAQLALGDFYLFGFFGERDVEKGYYLLEQAAENGRPDVYARLGTAYKLGFYNMPINLWKAVDYYTKGALAGDAESQYELGRIYARGRGYIPKDYALARKWYQAAADQGHKDAIEALSSLYRPLSTRDRIQHMISEARHRANMLIISNWF